MPSVADGADIEWCCLLGQMALGRPLRGCPVLVDSAHDHARDQIYAGGGQDVELTYEPTPKTLGRSLFSSLVL